MRITLADPAITVEGWLPVMDSLGAYTLRKRKSPEQLKQERADWKNRHPGERYRAKPTESIRKSVLVKDEKDPSVCYFLPGLWPRVREWLDASHVEYELVDQRNQKIRPEPDYSVLADYDLRENQDVALALLCQSDCGIIETTTGWGKGLVLSILCRMYPTLNIVVTTSSAQVVSTLYEYLCKAVPGQVGIMAGGKDTTNGKRVVVSTLKSLPNINEKRADLVLVDECHSVGDNLAGEALSKFCFARRFGFSASPIRNDGTERVMESILGPSILKMTYQESAEAGMVTPLRYLMLRCTSCPPAALSMELPDVFLKRWSYWCNISRNRVIANFVTRLRQRYDGQILIMCSTLEHCIRLHQFLPYFKVAYAGGKDMKDLAQKFSRTDIDVKRYEITPKQLDIMRMAFAKGTLRYVVCTKSWRAGVNFPHLSVLVRADADVSGIEGIQIPGRLSRLDADKDWAYLVDVYDSFSNWAERRSKDRQKLYNEQQWQETTEEEMINDLGGRGKADGG